MKEEQQEIENPPQIFKAVDLTLKTVTVFLDRAELLRLLNVNLKKGINEIVIENLSPKIDEKSIRVDRKGRAYIQDVHFKTDHAIDDETDSPKAKKNKLEKEIFGEREIQELNGQNSHKKSISIILETKENECVVNLEVSYQVNSASWTPFYDVRVKTGSNNKFEIHYFGNICQKSGEDWNDAELILSTARPRYDGFIPVLTTLQSDIDPKSRKEFATRMLRASISTTSSDNYNMDVENQLISTTFKIAQRKNIPSNNRFHKVTVAVLEFVPILHYDCVPSKDTNVFLTATAINNSEYPILMGNASIYFKNSFSSKIQLKHAAIGEQFDCPLGGDSTVKIQYRPPYIFKQQTCTKNKSVITIYEQKIQIKNTKSTEVLLTILDQIPKSTDKRIKIKLISPTNVKKQSGLGEVTGSNICLVDLATPSKLKLPEIGILMDDQNIIKWTLQLAESEEKELILKYSIEHPQNETLKFKRL